MGEDLRGSDVRYLAGYEGLHVQASELAISADSMIRETVHGSVENALNKCFSGLIFLAVFGPIPLRYPRSPKPATGLPRLPGEVSGGQLFSVRKCHEVAKRLPLIAAFISASTQGT